MLAWMGFNWKGQQKLKNGHYVWIEFIIYNGSLAAFYKLWICLASELLFVIFQKLLEDEKRPKYSIYIDKQIIILGIAHSKT